MAKKKRPKTKKKSSDTPLDQVHRLTAPLDQLPPIDQAAFGLDDVQEGEHAYYPSGDEHTRDDKSWDIVLGYTHADIRQTVRDLVILHLLNEPDCGLAHCEMCVRQQLRESYRNDKSTVQMLLGEADRLIPVTYLMAKE